MMNYLISRLKNMSLWNLVWISLLSMEAFTAIMNIIMNLLWWGKIDLDLLLIGTVDAFVIGSIVTIICIVIFKNIRNDEGDAVDAIRSAKDVWERTFDGMSDLIMIVDTKHKVVRANKAMADKLGLIPSKTVGITCYEHVHGLTGPPPFCAHSKCLLDGRAHSVEVYEERLGGHYLVTVSPLFNAIGEVAGSVHIARDITARKRAEEKLRETNTLLQALIHAIPDVVFFKDAQNRYLIANKAMEEFTGRPQGHLVGRTDKELLPPDLAEECGKSDEEVAKTRKVVRFEELYSLGDTKGFLETIKAPVFDDRGNLAGLVGISRDITDRKQMEEDLRRSSREKDTLLKEKEKLIAELQEALATIKRLHGILPICASCKKIRDDNGYWTQVESYIREHSEAEFTHGICPECVEKLYPGLKLSG